MMHRDHRFLIDGPEGFLPIAWRSWGEPGAGRVLVCVHGLSRNRMDFDDVGAAMAEAGWYVVAPDMPGRGDSGWLTDPGGYGYPLYEKVLVALVARACAQADAQEIDWLGTSMGGILGMRLAARPGTPIRRLVVNDIGPFVPESGRKANVAAFDADLSFADEEEGIAWIRTARAAFGPFTEDAFRKFARDTLTRREDGRWVLSADPGIMAAAQRVGDLEMWEDWRRIVAPTLVVWGTESKLLLRETVARMQRSGPRAEVFAVPGVGHCPGLTTPGEIEAVRAFLRR